MDFALYLISLILFSALTVLAVFFFPKWKNALLVDIVSVSLITGLYLVFVLTRYLDVGIYDWNFQNALPTANVSPFMFFTLPIFFLLRGRARKVFAALIALLSVGMFLSPTISIIRYMAIGYAFHLHFLLDFIAHYLLCLFGIYLVRTEQASLEKKDVL
ncbi:MAG: hypothetical protein J5736_04750, partial [Bacilli bacterium]|nr:hypothetical protein [Bacilli bacterium]